MQEVLRASSPLVSSRHSAHHVRKVSDYGRKVSFAIKKLANEKLIDAEVSYNSLLPHLTHLLALLNSFSLPSPTHKISVVILSLVFI